MANIDGTPGDDNLEGTEGDDTILGYAGNDSITGGGGNDYIDSDIGADTIDGGSGNDTIDSSWSSHQIQGGDGVDWVTYQANSGGVTVDLDGGGSSQLDTLAGIENVEGGSGDDVLIGDSGDNNLAGGSGNDLLRGAGGNDTLNGGFGFDTVDYSLASGGVNVDLSSNTVTGPQGDDTLVDVEGADGSAFNDTLTGDGSANALSGGEGNDVIDGGGGDDTLSPGAGTADVVNGGDGSDTLVFTGGWQADFRITRSGDQYLFENVNPSRVIDEKVTVTGIEFVKFGDGTTVALGDLEFQVDDQGTSGDDSITGGAWNDTLGGGAGNDTLDGAGGDDWLEGGEGNDSLVGGGGFDLADYSGASAGVTVALSTGVVSGGAGADTLGGIEGAYGSEHADTLNGSSGADALYGNGGTDSLAGGGGNDTLEGGAGRDTLRGGFGDDSIDGGVAQDRVNWSDGNFLTYSDAAAAVTINLSGITADGTEGSGTVDDGSSGTDTVRNVQFITGSSFNDSITGSASLQFEMFEGGAGNDTIDGGNFDFVTQINANRVSYQGAGAAVQVDLEAGTATGGAGNDVLININQVRGSASADTLLGSDRTDLTEQFEGRAGNDTINGRGGFDIARYDAATTGVTVNLALNTASDGQGGTDTLSNIEGVYGSDYNDSLVGGNAANGTTVTDGLTEIFRGGAGNDTIDGGQGYDRVDYTNATSAVSVTLGGTADGSASDGLGGTDVLRNIEGVRGSEEDDTLTGSSTAAFESFEGNIGDDIIDGQGGIDRADYDRSADGVDVNLVSGTAADGYGDYDTLSGIENVRGSRFGDDEITGDGAANRLEGQGGNDDLSGGGGNDTLVGGDGADSLYGGAGADVLDAGGGSNEVDGGADADTLVLFGTFASYSIERIDSQTTRLFDGFEEHVVRGVENFQFSDTTRTLAQLWGNSATEFDDVINGTTGPDTLDGLGGNDSITGIDGNDSLIGGTGNDTLDGGVGNDTMLGGAGNDTYVINVLTDSVNETAPGSGGTDTVLVNLGAAGLYTLGANVENATAGGALAINLTGNAEANTLIGNNAANTLAGGAGNDALIGGGGNDVLNGEAGGDFFRGGAGNDTINGGVVGDRVNYVDGNSLSYSDSSAAVNINLSAITGDGGTGTGTVSDGFGGTDTVSNVQFITGSAFNDTITGSGARIFEQFEGGAGNDVINGGAMSDTLNQADGNRVNYTNAGGSVVVDLAAGTATGGAGNDTLSNFNQVRGSIYDDTLRGSDRTDYTEHYEGRGGNDLIDGRGGLDIVRYTFAPVTQGINANLVTGIVSDGQGGTDTLVGIEGVMGTNFDDTLTGGNAANGVEIDDGLIEIFRGEGGNDLIDGGQGYDRADYSDSTASVFVDMNKNTVSDGLGGTDTLVGVEAIRGSELADSFTGSDAEFESFEGRGGNDTIIGGGGMDRVDYSGATAGVTVNLGSNFASGDASVGSDVIGGVEAVRGSRDFADSITGGLGGDWLVGQGGNDTIVGGAGNDSLEGGLGNDSLNGGANDDEIRAGTGTDAVDGGDGSDTLVVLGNEAGYVVSRTASDTVLTNTGTGEAISLRNIETVQYADATRTITEVIGNSLSEFADNYTGTEGDDSINGLGGNDTLNGAGGNDTIIGGAGNDLMRGGTGNDNYVVDAVGDSIEELENEGVDHVSVGLAAIGTYVLGANVENATVTSAVAVNLTGNGQNNSLVGNAVNNVLDGGSGNDTLDGGAGNDTLLGGAGNDVYLINVLTDVVNETAPGSGGTDTVVVALAAAGTYALGANVENATVSIATSVAVNLTGNAEANTLSGNNAANTLAGGAGNDALIGGGGNDILNGEAGGDFLRGGAGNDTINGGVVTDRVNYVDGNSLSYSDSSGAVNVNLTGITLDGGSGTGTVSDGFGGIDTVSNVQFITGSAFNDTITGSGARIFEQFEGGAGDDVLNGGAMTDTLNQTDTNRVNYGGAGAAVTVDLAAGTATGGAGNDTLSNFNQVRGSIYGDTLLGSDRTDYSESFEGRGGDDLIDGRGGIDIARYAFTPATEGINANLVTGIATDGQGGTDTLVGIEGLMGTNFDDTLIGGNADNGVEIDDGLIEIFRGEGGNDSIDGGQGYDRADYYDATSGVTVNLATGIANDGVGGTDTLVGIEAIRGSSLGDSFTGSDGEFESFEGGAGNDTINGAGGMDRADYNTATAAVTVNLGSLGIGTATGDASVGTDSLSNIEAVRGSRDFADSITGSGVANWLVGQGGNDTITGAAGNDTLEGGAGNDALNGGADDDVLRAGTGTDAVDGGDGSDTLEVLGNEAAYVVTRTATDTVLTNTGSGEAISLRNVEFVKYADATRTLSEVIGNSLSEFGDDYSGSEGDDSINGLGGNDTLRGLGGNDTIVGGAGNDAMIGGAGNDSYVVDAVGDTVVEEDGGGTDSVTVGFAGSYTLGNFVEAGTALAGALAINITGNAQDNLLTGNSANNLLAGAEGNDTLDGGTGNDTLQGGAGDDSYFVNVATDVVTEAVDAGNDTVNVNLAAAAAYTLGNNIENGVAGGTTAVGLTGNALHNQLIGNTAASLLSGGEGNDTLTGGGGNDTLDGGAGDDRVMVNLAFSSVTVGRNATGDVTLTGGGAVLTLRNVETVEFTDGAKTLAEVMNNSISGFADSWTGTEGNDSVDALAGNDTLSGLGGNDTLVGGAGNDSMAGGDGNDTYGVDAVADIVTELDGGGTDTVNFAPTTALVYTLGNFVENGTVTAGATIGAGLVGNGLGNTLAGNAAANSLTGAGGDDSLSGLGGNDTLNGGEGNDTLDGGAGNDSLAGGTGDDRYVVDSLTDIVSEGVDAGTDTVQITLSTGVYTLANNVEDASLGGVGAAGITGNALANQITGNLSANALSGGDGNDTITGGAGNDTIDGGLGTGDRAVLAGSFGDYVASRNTAGDVVLTGAGQVVTLRGIEVYQFADGDKTPAEVLNNSISPFADAWTGTEGNDSIDGLAGNDTLTGLGGHDTLVGGAGNDSLVGGEGNDTYGVDAAGDVIVELEGGGTDTVNVAFTVAGTYTLGNLIENATVTAGATIAVNLTGNSGDNALTGNAAANILNGGIGNDTLDGGAGTDNLIGGAGDDTYVINVTTDIVNETAVGSTGTDTVLVGLAAAGGYTLGTGVENGTVTASINGVNITGNTVANVLTGGSGNNTLSGLGGNDTLTGGLGNDILDGGADTDTVVLAGAVEDYVVTRPAAGQTLFTHLASGRTTTVFNVEFFQFDSGDPVPLGDLVGQIGSVGDDNLTGGSGADTLDGAAGNDTVAGMGGDDTLWGGTGIDRMIGGVGQDILDGGDGNDTYVHLQGDGDDLIEQNDTLSTSVDTVAIEDAGLGAGNVSFTRGYHTYDDLVINITTGSGDAEVVEKVVVLNFFNDDAINTGGAIDAVRLTQGTVATTDDVVFTQAQIAALANTSPSSTVFMGTAAADSLIGDDDAEWMLAGSGADVLSGNTGNDTLYGGAGNDSLAGGADEDLLVGGAGADMLAGAAGNDSLSGGAGNDTYMFGEGGGYDVISEALFDLAPGQLQSGVGPMYVPGEGDSPARADVDTLSFTADVLQSEVTATRNGDDLVLTLTSLDSVRIADYFAAGVTTIERVLFASGGSWSATAIRTKVLQPTELADEITGYLAGETLRGLGGDDLIDGREGNDTIIGGAGGDLLTGGSGADRFVLDNLDGVDTIIDFVSGVDTIALSVSLFGALGSVGNRVGLSDNLTYDSGSGLLAYDADGAGGSDAVVIALIGRVGEHPASLGFDFLLVA